MDKTVRDWSGRKIVRKRPDPLVRRMGLEPTRLLLRQDLNLVRLPIPPPSPEVEGLILPEQGQDVV